MIIEDYTKAFTRIASILIPESIPNVIDVKVKRCVLEETTKNIGYLHRTDRDLIIDVLVLLDPKPLVNAGISLYDIPDEIFDSKYGGTKFVNSIRTKISEIIPLLGVDKKHYSIKGELEFNVYK